MADVELMFSLYDKTNRYLVHNAYIEIPKIVKKYPFDAVIMMSTFMDKVAACGLSGRWFKQYKFLKDTRAIKIVFPQDDYWFSEVRDKFYADYKVNRVYPVCPPPSWNDLIPNYLAMGGEARQGYTTYLTPRMLDLEQKSKPWTQRKKDVVYRAKKTPAVPNSYGYMKGILGDVFIKTANNSDLKLDISTDPVDLIFGEAWYEFIADSKSILGSNSGSSVNLRNHEIFQKLKRFQNDFPSAGNFEVEERVFDFNDRNKTYTALSPRNVEAAMLGTLQILVEGSYGGLLKPYEDYLPLAQDCSNANTILQLLEDKSTCIKITENCRNKIKRLKELNVEYVTGDAVDFIRTKCFRADSKKKLARQKYFEALVLLHRIYSGVVMRSKHFCYVSARFVFYLLPSALRVIVKRAFRGL